MNNINIHVNYNFSKLFNYGYYCHVIHLIFFYYGTNIINNTVC